LILHGFARWTFIAVQVLDGPPGLTTRRLSSFLLIPVGTTGRDLQFLARIFRAEFSVTPKPDRITRDGCCCRRASSCRSSSCRPTRSRPRFPLP